MLTEIFLRAGENIVGRTAYEKRGSVSTVGSGVADGLDCRRAAGAGFAAGPHEDFRTKRGHDPYEGRCEIAHRNLYATRGRPSAAHIDAAHSLRRVGRPRRLQPVLERRPALLRGRLHFRLPGHPGEVRLGWEFRDEPAGARPERSRRGG